LLAECVKQGNPGDTSFHLPSGFCKQHDTAQYGTLETRSRKAVSVSLELAVSCRMQTSTLPL